MTFFLELINLSRNRLQEESEDMATIKDVAKLAGVSVATVSRALNDSGYVSEESRKKVEQAIKELEFTPNEVARSLFQKSSKIIGLLLPDISNPYFPIVAKGVEDRAQEKGYMVILGNVEDNPEKETTYMKFFSQYNISGVLSVAVVKNSRHTNGPYVLLERASDKEDYSVSTDDVLGGRLAAEAIAKHAKGKVIVIAGPKEVQGSVDRLIGNIEVLKEKYIDYEVFESGTFQISDAEKIAYDLFERYTDFDSVIASNDVTALAIIKEAHKRGLTVPEDLQLIGYDNIPFSQLSSPGLTTIGQPAYDTGYKGATLLLNLIEKKPIHNKKVKLKPELVVRETLRKES